MVKNSEICYFSSTLKIKVLLISWFQLDEACEKYTQAGSRFKIDQKWSSAGECYETAANIQLNKLENKHESAQNFVEAGNCFRKSDPKRASDCLKAAIEVYIDLGR